MGNSPRIKVLERCPVDRLVPNTWNPNRMDDWLLAKLREHIARFGFVDPILVRPIPNTQNYEIIDGEHRWKAAKEMGLKEIPVIVIEGISEKEAKLMTLAANELKGKSDPTAVFDIVLDLTNTEFYGLLPFPEETIEWILSWQSLAETTTAESLLSEGSGILPNHLSGVSLPTTTKKEQKDSPTQETKPVPIPQPKIKVELPATLTKELEKVRIRVEETLKIAIGTDPTTNVHLAIIVAAKLVDQATPDQLMALSNIIKALTVKG
jgi:hypothetical protein